MLQLAQDMLKALQERFRTTLHVVADLAESVGAPPSATSLLHRLGGVEEDFGEAPGGWEPPPPPPPAATPEPPPSPVSAEAEAGVAKSPAPRKTKTTGEVRRELSGKELPDKVKALKADDAIEGSTYLARIIWSLGVSDREGIGPLRPADIAKMIMARSPISLEPPNVARYIRRSKPTCIVVDHKEGSSSFYKLNDEGQSLFERNFVED
jgi:hypothetical protein